MLVLLVLSTLLKYASRIVEISKAHVSFHWHERMETERPKNLL